jgi:hypothetical protein
MACCSPVMAQMQTQTKERHTAIAIIEATACIRARRIRHSRMRGAVCPILTARLLSSSSQTPLVDVRACSLTILSDIFRPVALHSVPYVAYLPQSSHPVPTSSRLRTRLDLPPCNDMLNTPAIGGIHCRRRWRFPFTTEQ